jgi:drug/metabolite transporter (DMT)-like permease
MTWQLAILIHQILETIFALVYRDYAKKHPKDHFVTNAVMYLATVVPFGIVWSITQGGFSLDFPVSIWWFFGLAGLLFALGNIAAFKANTKVEASQFAIITRFRVVVIVAASWVLLGDTLTPLQFLGACIVFGSSLSAVLLTRQKKRKSKVGIYTLIAVLSAVFMGLAITSEKYILSSVNLATYVVIGWGLQAFFMTLLANRQLARVPALIKDGSIKTILLLGGLRTVAGFCFINALQLSDNASLIGSIAALQVILVVIGGYIFLNEKKYGVQKFVAASAAFMGVLLLVN